MSIYLIHLGAREHYAVPRMLVGGGRPVVMMTDFWAGRRGRRWLGCVFPAAAQRYHPELAEVRVEHCPGFAWRYRKALAAARTALDKEKAFVQFGEEFSRLAAQRVPSDAETILSFSTTARECFRENRGRRRLVLDQIDGGVVEDRMVDEERRRFPDWEEPAQESFEFAHERMRDEWDLADTVVVNSDFSARCLAEAGVPAEKISVIPLAYEQGEAANVDPPLKKDRGGGLRLLFAGTLCLRKGVHYLHEAVLRLRKGGMDVSLTLAGGSALRPEKLDELRRHHEVLGQVPRACIRPLMNECDALVLPSIAEGFGMVQLEALAAGLPVIATENCARVVTGDANGRIIRPFSAEAVMEACQWLHERQSLQGRVPADSSGLLEKYRLNNVGRLWCALDASSSCPM